MAVKPKVKPFPDNKEFEERLKIANQRFAEELNGKTLVEHENNREKAIRDKAEKVMSGKS